MRKRVRKKLRLGEFQEMGFKVAWSFREGTEKEEIFGFWERFIDEAIEARNLAYGGGGGLRWEGFVARAGRGSASDEDREFLESWLANEPLVDEPAIGELVDAWCPSES